MRSDIHKRDIIALLCFMPFLKTNAFKYLAPVLDILIDAWLIFVGIFLCYIFIKNKNITINKNLCYLFVIGIITVFSSYISNGLVVNSMISFGKLFVAYLFVDAFFIRKPINATVLLFPIIILFILNIACWIVYPGGMYTMVGANNEFFSNEVWLIGGKNAYFYYCLFAIVLFYVDLELSERKNKIYKIKELLFWGLLLFNMIVISQSATGIICLIILFVLECLFIEEWITKKELKIGIGICCLLIYELTFNNSESILLLYISEIMQKDITLTGRTLIWERSVEAILSNPLWGYGVQRIEDSIYMIGQTTSHNKYLWIIYRGGIFSLLAFMLFLNNCIKNILRYSHNVLAKRLYYVFVMLLIAWMVEVYDNNCLVFMFLVLCQKLKFDQYSKRIRMNTCEVHR